MPDMTSDLLHNEATTIRNMLRAPQGKSSTFRYVLPTQLVAKLANPALDCHSVQARGDDPRQFNARDVAKYVVVPFNRDNGSPLGTTSDPYVNNPLRVPSITPEFRAQQSDHVRWDALCRILDEVQEYPDTTLAAIYLDQVLIEIRRLVEDLTVSYVVPQRISHPVLMEHLKQYLAPRTGGRRFQAICVALFRTAGVHWGFYDEVISSSVNVADISSGRPADIECRQDGKTVLAVETKDTTLTLSWLEDKIVSSRAAEVWELLFLIRGTPLVESDSVQFRADREAAAGHNIYILSAESFMKDILAWLGESGRHQFTTLVGEVLDELCSDYTDRRAWADVLNHW